ncbi:unnamed protein product [Moneuplotes crassus]|uniref:Uncharacterized protein n=1 Tax=Euplotes crassus TaxID=5936 RepID=A0AAD1X599_EUPCR|nr:unnamed protein product [Moneuplotes crassus]
MHPTTRWLAVDLTGHSKKVIITQRRSLRHGSDERRLKSSCISTFSSRISSTSGSIELDDIPKVEPIHCQLSKNKGEAETRVSSDCSAKNISLVNTEGSCSPEFFDIFPEIGQEGNDSDSMENESGVKKQRSKSRKDRGRLIVLTKYTNDGVDEQDDLLNADKIPSRTVQKIPSSIQSHVMPQSPTTPNSIKLTFPWRKYNERESMPKNSKTLKNPRFEKILVPDDLDYWLPSSYEELMNEEKTEDSISNLLEMSNTFGQKAPDIQEKDLHERYVKLKDKMKEIQRPTNLCAPKSLSQRKSECDFNTSKKSTKIKSRFFVRNKKNSSTKKLMLSKINLMVPKDNSKEPSHNEEIISYNSSATPLEGINEMKSGERLTDPTGFLVYKPREIKAQPKNKHEMEAIGFIDHEFQFVLPNCDLEPTKKTKNILSLEKLNIFKLLEKESPHQPDIDKSFALNLIKEITEIEMSKYQHDPLMKKVVTKILEKGTLQSK